MLVRAGVGGTVLLGDRARGSLHRPARLHSLDPVNRRARYAVGLFDRAAWGHGLGTEATRLVLAFGFETLYLHRIDLRVPAYNERAIAAYRRSGFVIEGVERESVLVAGEWHSDVIMSILEHEYRREHHLDGTR